jgi:hypothetical protein
MKPMRRALIVAAAFLLAAPAWAGIPPGYGAIVVAPPSLAPRAEFDLTEALARAKREGKWLYVYLGASDCPYCRQYEAFLRENEKELLPHFGKSTSRWAARAGPMRNSSRRSATSARGSSSIRAFGCWMRR